MNLALPEFNGGHLVVSKTGFLLQELLVELVTLQMGAVY
jgi:hypothetical protein